MFLKTWNVCLLRMICFLVSPCPQRISLRLVLWCSGTASFLTPLPVSRGHHFSCLTDGLRPYNYLAIMLIMSSCNHLRNTCLAPFMFSEHVAAISDMATFGLVNHSQFFLFCFSLICLVVSAASIFPYGRINWLGKWLYHVTAACLLCWKDRDVEVFNDIFWTKWFDLENGQNFLHCTTELTVPNFCVAT